MVMDITQLIYKLTELRRYYPDVTLQLDDGTPLIPTIETHELTGTPYLTFIEYDNRSTARN
jgi:hypothetical protein